MKIDETKLRDKFAEILMSPQKNKQLERLIDAVYWVMDKQRTSQQNKSLHVLFKQVSDDCLDKGVEMRQLVRDDVPIQCTPENIKWLWKLLQEGLFKKKSTTELKKTGEIDIVYDNFNKVLIERTQGEISLPKFPRDEEKQKEFEKQMQS